MHHRTTFRPTSICKAILAASLQPSNEIADTMKQRIVGLALASVAKTEQKATYAQKWADLVRSTLPL